ncbi:MAG: hypothetical protein AB7F32_11780, partial [Victivallaceae bacterium]
KVSGYGENELAVGIRSGAEALLVAAAMRRFFPEGLDGEIISCRHGFLLVTPLNAASAAVLRRILPWTAPGTGDERPVWLEFPPGSDPAAAFAAAGPDHLPVFSDLCDPVTFYVFRQNLRSPFAVWNDPVSPLHAGTPIYGDAVAADGFCGKTFVADRRALVFGPATLERAVRLVAPLRRELLELREVHRERARLFVAIDDLAPEELLFLGRELGSGVIFAIPEAVFALRAADFRAALHFSSCAAACREGCVLTLLRG